MLDYIISTIISNLDYDNYKYSITEKNGTTIISCNGVEIKVNEK